AQRRVGQRHRGHGGPPGSTADPVLRAGRPGHGCHRNGGDRMKLNTRAARRELMIEIIRNNAVASQSELVEALRERGIDVTQATVSRDLDEMGAVKTMSADGRLLYAV